MASIEVSADIRSRLRQFLTERFSLSELKDLSFDLGVDYEMFPHQTKGELSRELLGYFERNQNLSCLVAEMTKQRPDDELVSLLAELGSCSPRSKVQIVLPADKLENRESLLSELAKVLGVSTDEVMLIATAPGSIRLLVSLPAEAAEQLLTLNPDHLGETYEITSIDSYESLSPEQQTSWRQAALKGKPPATFLGLSGWPLVLALVVGGALIAAAILITGGAVAAPQAKVTNSCNFDIEESQAIPILGTVSINLKSNQSRNYRIPPGTYEFNYDGREITVRVPLVTRPFEFNAPGDIDALYENELIREGQTLRDTIELFGRRSIVLCPSGN
jgi:hypothetical protein